MVLFEGFPKILYLSNIINAVHDISGLKSKYRDVSEILGIFKSTPNDRSKVDFFILFKYKDVFKMISDACETISGEKFLIFDGHKIKMTLPDKVYYRTKLVKSKHEDEETFTSKAINNDEANIARWASYVEEVISTAEITSTSTNEVRSIFLLNTGEVTVTFETEKLKDEFQFQMVEKGITARTVMMKAVPHKAETITADSNDEHELPSNNLPQNRQNRRDIPKRDPPKRDFNEHGKRVASDLRDYMQNRNAPNRYHQPAPRPLMAPDIPNQFHQMNFNPPRVDDNGFKKLRITPETRQLLQLIASPKYEVFVRKIPDDDYNGLFE